MCRGLILLIKLISAQRAIKGKAQITLTDLHSRHSTIVRSISRLTKSEKVSSIVFGLIARY